MRILICDDDDQQRAWLEKQFLSVDGFDTFTASIAGDQPPTATNNWNVVASPFRPVNITAQGATQEVTPPLPHRCRWFAPVTPG